MAVMRASVLSAVVWLDLAAALGGLELRGCQSTDDTGARATHLAYTNCSAYYRCKQETRLVFSCLANLPFSGREKVCDDQLNANCGQLPTTTESPPETVTTEAVVTEAFKEVVAVKPNYDDDDH